MTMINRLWKNLTWKRRKQFASLAILMIFASIMEVISIGSVVPFLGALTSPDRIFENKLAQPFISLIGITKPAQLLLPLTILFISSALISASVRLFLLYVSTRFAFSTAADLSIDIYRRTLYQDYSTHISRNSSEIINGIITKTNTVISKILVPILNLISSVIIMTGIVSIIFMINAYIAVVSFTVFGFFYSIIAFLTKKTLLKNSKLIANESDQMIKSLQEGLGGIRDVLITGSQEFYCKLYRDADLTLRRASGENVFISSCPRYFMEGVGMILIAILAYVLTVRGGIESAFPMLGALAVGAQKLLPALQQAYSSVSLIKGANKSFVDVLDLLDQKILNTSYHNNVKPLSFLSEIKFEDVSFRYSKESPYILKNINLVFGKGEKIGLIGVTGSGKRTLLDILMGLLIPTSGKLLIDGDEITHANRKNWQARISHVPQNIYLADGTVKENIAFGVSPEKIDDARVILASQQAKISSTIDDLDKKYNGIVGEQGIKLSGGQKQRIGIARALYRSSDVLIFDEATSALDNTTEEGIMRQIDKLNKDQTVFIIAHRLSTLKNCDRIIRVNNEYSIDQLEYSQIKTSEMKSTDKPSSVN